MNARQCWDSNLNLEEQKMWACFWHRKKNLYEVRYFKHISSTLQRFLRCSAISTKRKSRLFKLQERITKHHGTIIIKQEKALLIEGSKNSRRLKGYGTAALSMSGSAPYLDGNLLRLFWVSQYRDSKWVLNSTIQTKVMSRKMFHSLEHEQR